MSGGAQPPAGATVLLVEDDANLRSLLRKELGRCGFHVVAHDRGTDVVPLLAIHQPGVVLLDLHLPGAPGMDVLQQLVRHDPDLAIVVCTGHGSVALAVEAMQRGAYDFLQKPVELDTLEATMRRALAHAELRAENRRLKVAAAHGSRSALVVAAPSAASKRLEQQIDRIATADQNVLIGGESGTGKELVARRLHTGSRRSANPFVVVHCGAIPRQLVESELFGHTKGAFTGAEDKRLGLFEAAHGGTLFLDEVGELPIEAQPALLRAAQFGEIRPVGSNTVRQVDVRIVAATWRDLRAMATAGTFREDLFYRLAVLELAVPPLRERREDIGALATAFLQREAQRAGRTMQFDAAALQRLEQHDWPGNVRELENTIVRLGVLCDAATITAADIEAHGFAGPLPIRRGGLPSVDLGELERLAIAQALEQSGGNKTRAAALLGIALKTLYNKLNTDPDSPAQQ